MYPSVSPVINKRRVKLSTPHFYLKDKKCTTETLINLIYLIGSKTKKKLKYSTKIKIKPTFWDFNKERAKLSVNHTENIEINNKLANMQSHASVINMTYPDISVQDFKLKLDKAIQQNSFTIENDLYPEFITFIENFVHFEKNKTNPTITYKKYNSVLNHLKAYNSNLKYSDITLDFFDKYPNWLFNNTNVKSQNSVSRDIEVIKTVMEKTSKLKYIDIDGTVKKYHNNLDFKEFSAKRVLTTKHDLTYEELIYLLNFDLSQNKRLERVRDIFLIAAFTGLRYSDFSRLTKNNIKQIGDKKIIEIHTFKGNRLKADNKVIIPVFPELDEILTKFNYEFPKVPSSQKMNDYLKELCKLVGLDRLVLDKSSVKGKIIEKYIPLYSAISNHTARYTFISIMLNHFELSPYQIMQMTGQTLKTLMGYAKEDKTMNALTVLDKIINKQKKV